MSSSSTDSLSSGTWCHSAAGDGFCVLPARLLQLGASGSSVVHSIPTTAGTEYCSTVDVWTAASWSRDISAHSTALVAYTLANFLQSLYFNARTPNWTLPFLFGRRRIDELESDCNPVSRRTVLHQVYVLLRLCTSVSIHPPAEAASARQHAATSQYLDPERRHMVREVSPSPVRRCGTRCRWMFATRL